MHKGLVFNCSVSGASHLDSGRECQDSSLSWQDDNVRIVVISDGHGGERYVHSSQGSKSACEVTLDTLREFYLSCPKLFTDDSLKQLAACIVARWHEALSQYCDTETCQSLDVVEYGCTLMACIMTPDFWLAFQIGDGRCVILSHNREWIQPVPWDDRCFLNVTTSMCDPTAASEFRFAHGDSDSMPLAVFLGSDGLDGTFGEGDNLYGFYKHLYKSIKNDGIDSVLQALPEVLLHYSRTSVGDDMTVAAIIDVNSSNNT